MSGGLGSLEEMGVLATWDQDEGRGLPCESSCNIFMFSTMSGTTLPSLHTTVPVLYCVAPPPSPMLPTCAPAAHASDVTLPCTLAAHAPTSRPHTRCHSHAHWPPTHLMPPECTPAAHTPDTTRMYTGRPHTHQPPAYSLAVLVVVSADVAEVSSKGLHGQRAGDFSAPPLDNDACGGETGVQSPSWLPSSWVWAVVGHWTSTTIMCFSRAVVVRRHWTQSSAQSFATKTQ